MKLIFYCKFRFYTSKLNEICLHCHWLYFSSIIISFGQGGIWVINLSFCQNDPLMGASFWQKDSLISHILFNYRLLWFLALYQILVTRLYITRREHPLMMSHVIWPFLTYLPTLSYFLFWGLSWTPLPTLI